MKKIILPTMLLFSLLFSQCTTNDSGEAPAPEKPIQKVEEPPLKIGFSAAIGSKYNLEKLKYDKSVGVDVVEMSGMGAFLDEDRNFTRSGEKIIEKLKWAKKNADDAGIKIWSVHMPFGKNLDLSLADESDRKDVVAKQSQLIEYLKVLKPKIILFHPSYYLGENDRNRRKAQLLKSAETLNAKVQEIGATMVLENVSNPRNLGNTRPLFTTIAETEEVMDRLPESIGLAVDVNHIQQPYKMILAFGDRVKHLHISDGYEDHYFPCSGSGDNDWTKILSALNEVGYKNPFMFESAYDDEKDFLECYRSLYNDYLDQTK